MLAAMGTEPRLRIMRLLLSAHPDGMVVGDIHESLGIANSTLSHHLEKLKNEHLVRVRRDGTFLWYSANSETLRELLTFLCTECCVRNQVIEFKNIVAPGQQRITAVAYNRGAVPIAERTRASFSTIGAARFTGFASSLTCFG